MAQITKIDARTWRVRYDDYSTGKRMQRSKTFHSHKEAVAFRATAETGTAVKAIAEITLSEYLDIWYAAKRLTIAPNSQHTYRYAIGVLKKTALSGTELGRITPTMIRKTLTALLPPDGTLSASSAQTVRRMLASALKTAEDDGVILNNPCNKARLKNVEHAQREMDLQAIREQVEALSGTPAYLPCCLALYAGLRVGEVRGLRWESVDLDGGRIMVSETRSRYYTGDIAVEGVTMKRVGNQTLVVKAFPKNRKERILTIPDQLTAILRAEKLRQERLGIVSDYVCLGKLKQPISEAACSAGLGIRFHDLRHANISMLINAGVPVTEVARRVGHSSPAITWRVYAHADKDDDLLAADVVNNKMCK